MHFLDKLLDKDEDNKSRRSARRPPQWTPAAEQSHAYGKYNEATVDEYKEAALFCARVPVERPKLLSSDMVERLSQEGCRPWEMALPSSSRFKGFVVSGIDKGGAGVTKVVTDKKCEDVCIFSNLPIMAGLYDIKGKQGVYYEVVVREMIGFIAIGNSSSACSGISLANAVHGRLCMSSVPRLETPGMEPPQRWTSPRRSQEILRRPRRWPRLRNSRIAQPDFTRGLSRVRIRVRVE